MASGIPAIAEELAKRYWPGPLTLVLDKAERGTIGVRVPDHEVTRQLLIAYGGPLYATSANLAGETAPAAIEEVDGRVIRLVSAAVSGETGTGEASAVVDLSGDRARLLRATKFLTEDKLSRLAEGAGKNV
jgi:L-threonylcarbamoyladenylate synthase